MAKLLATRNINPAGGVNPAQEPNAGQYGWTNADAAHVNQLISYVDAARKAAEASSANAAYVENIRMQMDELIAEVTDLRVRVTALENKQP